MRHLDLRSVHLGQSNIAAYSWKRDAVAAAKSFGWPVSSVIPAANRFWSFWVIGQNIGTDTLRLVAKDGSTVEIPYPGWF